MQCMLPGVDYLMWAAVDTITLKMIWKQQRNFWL